MLKHRLVNADLLRQTLHLDSLPSIPEVAVRVVALCGRGDTSLQELGRELERDPAIAARLVRMANSAAFGRPHRVGTVSQAVVVLGLRTVRVVTLSSALLDGLGQRWIAGFDYRRFWGDAVVTGLAARGIAALRNLPYPEEAFLAGLLQDLGVYALATTLGERYLSLVEDAHTAQIELVELERVGLGLAHPDVSAALLERWAFPPHLTEAVRLHATDPGDCAGHEGPLALATCLFTAETVRRTFRQPARPVVRLLRSRWQRLLGVDRGGIAQVLDYVHRHFADTAGSLSLDVDAGRDLGQTRALIVESLRALTHEACAAMGEAPGGTGSPDCLGQTPERPVGAQ